MRCCSYNYGLIVLVMFGNFAKLDSPQRLVQFWQNFQASLVLLIPYCTRHRMIAYTNCTIIAKLCVYHTIKISKVCVNIGTPACSHA